MEQQPQFPVLAQRLEIAFQLTELERLLGWGEDVQDEINALQQQMQQLLQQLQNLAPPAAGRRAHSEPPRRRYGDDDDGAPRFRHRSAQ
ncbi:hypothetical protein niasHS_002127 [Heterodera schachtii]|uniref:Uncharacterized protein n=1 Tax=Heterodera schachtii TaxID=97005 RepID=A0ABD2KMC7_HETSC